MMLRPHFFTNLLAFSLGIPVVWMTVAMHRSEPSQPKLARGTMEDIAFAGAARGGSVVSGPVAPSAATVEVEDTRSSYSRGRNLRLPADLDPVNTEFGFDPSAANGRNLDGLFGARSLWDSTDAVAALQPVMQLTTGGEGSELQPPPLIGATPFEFGVAGGYGPSGSQGSAPAGVYFLLPGEEGLGWGIVGGLSPGSGSETYGNGTGGGQTTGDGDVTGIFAFSFGVQSAPEPSSWLLGLCAAGALFALRLARNGARKAPDYLGA